MESPCQNRGFRRKKFYNQKMDFSVSLKILPLLRGEPAQQLEVSVGLVFEGEECLHPFAGGGTHCGKLFRLSEQSANRIGKLYCVAGWNHQAGHAFVNDFGRSADIRGHDRRSCSHGFE